MVDNCRCRTKTNHTLHNISQIVRPYARHPEMASIRFIHQKNIAGKGTPEATNKPYPSSPRTSLTTYALRSDSDEKVRNPFDAATDRAELPLVSRIKATG
mgnify:CR=1 FL=1|jgi:CHASE2 domain-containing sensor protein